MILNNHAPYVLTQRADERRRCLLWFLPVAVCYGSYQSRRQRERPRISESKPPKREADAMRAVREAPQGATNSASSSGRWRWRGAMACYVDVHQQLARVHAPMTCALPGAPCESILQPRM